MPSPSLYQGLHAEVSGGTDLAVSAQDVVGGNQVQVSLPATLNVTNYLSHVFITSGAVAAVVSGVVTITGVVGAPLYFVFTETVSAGGWLDLPFKHPIPATGQNTAIVVTLPAIAGGAISAVSIAGWQA